MKRILTSIWFLAFVIALLVIILMPPIFNKYRLHLDYIDVRAGLEGNLSFQDLNSDGRFERIETFHAEQDYLSFQVFEGRGNLYNQFNFPHKFTPRLSKVFFFDTDDDGLEEVFGFTVWEDSIFLNYIEPYDPKAEFESVFITEIDRSRRTEYDANVVQLEYFDFDGDGNKELVFSISVGYNWFPRKLFVYHPEKHEVQSSKEFGVHFYDLTPFDFESDGNMELLCVSSSADNIPHDLNMPFTDDQPRLFLFNSALQAILPPIEFPVAVGSRLNYFLLEEKSGEILVMYNSYATENSSLFITRFNLKNSLDSDTLILDKNRAQQVRLFKENPDNFLIFTEFGETYKISRDLKILNESDLQFESKNWILGQFDFLEDGKPEYYTTDIDNSLNIFLDDLKVHLHLDLNVGRNKKISLVNSPQENQFVIVSDTTLHFYTISANPIYYFKFPFYVLLYLFVTGFLWLWQRPRIKLMEEKFELQEQVNDLRLKSFRNQLNPHFIFNTFNGVASVLKKGDTEKAYEVFIRFSKMTRTLLDSFDQSIVSLDKELELVKNYIELQKFRFKELFDYQINIDDKVSEEILIPRMIIQIHVENAIRHGLLPKNGKGFLKIDLDIIDDYLHVIIEDNGIGRDASKKRNNQTTGLGLKTIESLIEEINARNTRSINQNIVDLKDQNENSAGTRIEIAIPNNLIKL